LYGGRSRPRPHYARWGPSSRPQDRDHSPQFSAHVYCGQTAAWIKMPLSTEVGLGPANIVLDGDPARPPPKGPQPPIFGTCLLWPDGCMHLDTTWYGDRPQPRGHCVRWGPSSPSAKLVQSPAQFSAHVGCGKMAGWTKMPLGTEVDLGLGDVVPQLPLKGPHSFFGPCLLWPNGWMDEDATWYGSRPQPRPHCVGGWQVKLPVCDTSLTCRT